MHDVCIPAMTRSLAMVFEGSSCERIVNRHHGIAPSNHYRTQDGEISIFCLTQAHWLELTRLMGREDLERDPRFESPTRRSLIVEEVDSIVSTWCAGRQRDDLVALLAERGIPCAPVRSVEEVAFDPEVGKRRMLIDIDAPGSVPIKVLGTPVRLSTIDPNLPPCPPPALGEHTEEVLGSIGISVAEIRRLRDAGAI